MLKRLFILVIALGAVIGLDQVSKLWFAQHFQLHESMILFRGFALTLVHNQGAAFGMLSDGLLWQKLALAGIAIGVALVLFYLILNQKLPKLERLAYFFICAGAVGNLIDRIRLGYVIDFVDWYYDKWHWPAFNFADIYICLGAFLLAVVWVFSKR